MSPLPGPLVDRFLKRHVYRPFALLTADFYQLINQVHDGQAFGSP